MRKFYIYYRQYEVMHTVVILGKNPLDACCRAKANNLLKPSSNKTYYVNETGTTEKKRLVNFAVIKSNQIANNNC
jgi:hypothetical protein